MHRTELPVVDENCTAIEMIQRISQGGLGLIVICRGEEILGIVTDGDVRRAMESRQADFFNIRPMDIASKSPKTILADEKLIEAEKMMTHHKINSLLVVDQNKHLVGVIQIYDIKL